MSRLLNRLTLFKKMLLIFLGCSLIPLTMQNFYFYVRTEENIQKEMIDRLNSSMDIKMQQISGYINGAITLSRSYDTNQQIYSILEEKYQADVNYFTIYQDILKDKIATDMTYHPQVKQITIYTDNPTIFNGAFVRQLIPFNTSHLDENIQLIDETALIEANRDLWFRVVLRSSKDTQLEDRSMSIVRTLEYFPQFSQYEKLIRIDMNVGFLASIMKEESMFDNMILVDKTGRVVSSVNSYKDNGAYEIFQKEQLKAGMVILQRQIENVPLTLYGFYDTKMISRQFNKSKDKTFQIGVGALLFALVSVMIVAGNITKRTRLVVNQSKQIALGNFIETVVEDEAKDEISILERSMNHMSVQLKEHIDKEYSAQLTQARLERETTQAKLLALQSQVNPHFMFNALESIRLKAMAKNETETAKMIKYMSKMFRNLITWEEDFIRLQDDMDFLKEFLMIQKYRFEDEFGYELVMSEEARYCLLPKMLIQPLVENACVHGVEAITTFRRVSVTASVEDNMLVIAITDNGGGIAPDKLEKIRQMLHDHEKVEDRVGVYNVYQRLKLYYVDQFSMEYESVQGKGTTCIVKLPVER